MQHIIEAASTPLGLVALSLLLLFSLIPVSPRARRSRLLVSICVIAGATTIVAGLLYAFLRNPTSPEAASTKSNIINQQTRDKSPAISDVKGDVTIIIDESPRRK